MSDRPGFAPSALAQTLAARWRAGSVWMQDGVLAVALAAVAFAPPLAANGVALGELGQHRLGIGGSVLSAAQALPLVVRRRWPGWCLAVVAGAFGAYQLGGYRSSFAGVGLFIAVYSAGAHQRWHRPALAAAATAAYAVLAAVLATRGSPERVIDWITFYLLLVACWGAGAVIRSRAAAEEARRRQSMELAMVAERARIARELHDVVTHHVTAMVVQADATQFVLETAPDRATDGLGAISGTGRRALAELRHLLGVLEAPGDGRAGAADRSPVTGSLTDLVARISSGYTTIFGAQPDLEVAGEASDGRMAVDLARRLRPDVVVMDIRMPVLDGIEATRQLGGPGIADPIRVLVVTTFNVDEYVFDALRAGASGFLLKDALPAELVNGVQTIAGGESLLAPAVTRHLIGHFATRVRASDPAAPGKDHPLAALTQREREVLTHIAAGLSNAEIAGALVISPETVKTYVSRILAKLDLRDRVQAVVFAYQTGLVSAQD